MAETKIDSAPAAAAGHAGLEPLERDKLLLMALGLWLAIYVNLHIGGYGPPIDHQLARALRRIVTCAAGAGLCVAMMPILIRASLQPLGRQLQIAAGLSLLAYLAHLCVRLCVFHVYRPLWGPLSLDTVHEALGGDGWMFALYAAVALLVLAEGRHRHEARSGDRQPAPPEASGTSLPSAVWCTANGRRVRVGLADVILFAAERDYVRLHTRQTSYLLNGRLKDWERRLPANDFMQVHRSAIVRLSAIASLERSGSVWRLRLEGGTGTPVSRPKGKEVRQRLAAIAQCRLGDTKA